MELSFVVDAVRRYWWLVVMCAVLGGLPGLALRLDAAAEFESRAVLLVVPARDARVQINVTSENERYVLGQLSVLQSNSLAERVSEQLDDGTTAKEVLDSLSLNHLVETDIVEVAVRTSGAVRAQTIADAYVDAYIALLQDQVRLSQSPDIAAMDLQLSDIQLRLSTVDEAIAAAMAPFLETDAGPTGGIQQIPTPDQVVPGLVSERQILLTQYNQIFTSRNELSIGSSLRVATEVVERATTPAARAGGSGALVVVAGAMVGGFLGVLGAVALARVSRRVLSRRQVGELLGHPVVGVTSFPRFDEHNLADVSRGLTADQRDLIEGIRIRAEAGARPGFPVVVVVAGAEPCATVSMLAAALAVRWADEDLEALLIDADPVDPSTSRVFAPDKPGLRDLIGVDTGRSVSFTPGDFSTPIGMDNPAVVGLGRGQGPFRREEAEGVVASAAGFDAIVIDVGGLMESTAGLQLAGIADAVVLVVSHEALTTSVVSSQINLARSTALVLPVWSLVASERGVARRRRSRTLSQEGSGRHGSFPSAGPDAVPAR